VIVSVIAGLLLVGGGVMAYLWVSTASELDDTRADLTGQIDELNTTVADRDGEIDQLSDELQRTQDELSDAQTALEGTENQVDVLEGQQDQLRECLTLVAEAQAAADAGDQEASNALLAESEPICDEAFNALFG
jgi:chromosome segregation ATPase